MIQAERMELNGGEQMSDVEGEGRGVGRRGEERDPLAAEDAHAWVLPSCTNLVQI